MLLHIEEEKSIFAPWVVLEKFTRNPSSYPTRQKYELIIVGAGPAGLTAGVYASILKINTLLLSTDIGGQAVDSTKIRNYMGFDFISGPELSAKFRNQLLHEHYIDHRLETVISIRKQRNDFIVKTVSGLDYRSRALIAATGMHRNKLGVPGEKKFSRKGVCYTAGQDIPILAGKKVIVVGGGNSALQIALELKKHKSEIAIISIESLTGDPRLRDEVLAIKNIKIYEHHTILKIAGRDKIESVHMKELFSNERIRLDAEAVFVAIGFSPNSSVIKNLADLNDKGEVEINPDCSTKTPGVFATGDVTNVFARRIIVASGEGAKAALAAKQYLMGK